MSIGATVPSGAPALVPGVSSSYRNAWRQLWKYFLELFLIGIIYLILADLFAIPSWTALARGDMSSLTGGRFTLVDFLSIPYSFLVVTPLGYGVSFAYLKAARGDKLEIQDMFEGFRNYWNAVLASLLVAGIAIVGFVLLIIPGIIFALKLSFTPYLVTDRKMKVIEAVKESWRMTGGHTWKIFFIGLLGIPIMLVGLLALVVGIIPALIWISLAMASLYHAVSLSRPTPPVPTAPAA